MLETSVNTAMRLHIQEKLRELEQQHNVRVLYAAESGSRAWGFASPNSDYDVRFLYVPQPDWYLSVGNRRDVIEQMLPLDVDLSGWELRKALRLFRRYNGALNEWLASPICYLESGPTAAQMRALLPQLFKPAASLHHYASMAKAALIAMATNDSDVVSAKKLCYLLRALFACRHVLATRSQPPTEFASLLAQYCRDDAERQWIDQMLMEKSVAPEAAVYPVEATRRRAFADEIEAALDARANVGGARGRVKPEALDEVLRAGVMAS